MSKGNRTLTFRRASDIEMRPVFWAWQRNGYGQVPVGELTLLAGHGEAGKSTLQCHLISLLTRGKLPGAWFGKPQGVIIMAGEDSPEHTLAPRLAAAHANRHLVAVMDGVEFAPGSAKGSQRLSLPADYDEFEDAIKVMSRELGVPVRWVYLDSLVSAIDLSHDANKGQDVRAVLEPLADIARRHELVITGNVHFNKSSGQSAMDRISGSKEFVNVSRAVIYMARDRDGSGVISKAKNNLGKDWPSLEYWIDEVDLGGGITAPRIEITGETDRDANELIADSAQERKPGNAVQGVMEVLQELFAEQDTWDAKDVKAQIREAGESTNDRTLKRACEEMGIRVVPVHKPSGGVDHWAWTRKPRKHRPPRGRGRGGTSDQ